MYIFVIHWKSLGHHLPYNRIYLPFVKTCPTLFIEIFSDSTVDKIRIALIRIQSTYFKDKVRRGRFH